MERFIDRKYAVAAGLTVGILTGALMLLGVGVVLGNRLEAANVLAFISFGAVVGLVAAVLFYFRLKIAAGFFAVGLLFGYFEMFRAFLNRMSGWGDLVGILSMMLWPGVGLVAGLIGQTGNHIYRKYHSGRKKN